MSVGRRRLGPARRRALGWRIVFLAAFVYTTLRMIEMTVWLIRAVT